MESQFQKYLSTQTTLADDAIHAISSCAIPRTLRRNELLLEPGEVCRHKVFIVSGLLRNFITTANGNEHVLHFSPELTWTLDVESYDKEIPSAIAIGAVEPTEVLLWQKADFNKLLADIPLLKQFSEQLVARTMYYNRQRMATILSASPEEKYDDFTQRFPGLIARLPLHMIASHLGISLKTLTRIRHAQLLR